MVEREHLTPENFSEMSQYCLVQGIVVEVSDNLAHYVITHVHDGRDEILDDQFYPTYRTATKRSPWFSELPESYRALWMEAREEYEYDVADWHDDVELPYDIEVVVGDTIHVHQTMFWEPNKRGGKTGYPRIDVCKLPVPNIGLQAALEAIVHERAHKVQQALIEAASLEQAALQELERIEPGKPTRPFNNPGRHDINGKPHQTVRTQFVYGGGPVEDHFLNITASAVITMDLEYGGVQRFGTDGSQYLVPSIMPFGPGSEEDPLYELKIHVNSDTKLNPAVGEIRPQVVIDGIKYEALVDTEVSSVYFKKPGHDVIFNGFRQEGVEFDMVKLTDKQIAAFDVRFKRQSKIALDKLYGSIDRGEDFASSLEVVDEAAEKEVQAQNELDETEQALIESITQNVREYTISTGAAIQVPRSMLDAIEINIASIGD